MLINKSTAISTPQILLVPYSAHHVPTYHMWMQSPSIQAATASEPLSLDEEYAMQRSWRTDADKLTFIVSLPLNGHSGLDQTSDAGEVALSDRRQVDGVSEKKRIVNSGIDDAPERMVGDVNLFLTREDEEDEEDGQDIGSGDGRGRGRAVVGELELMIAPTEHRRRGHGRAAILTFLVYLKKHLPGILDEYGKDGAHAEDMRSRAEQDRLTTGPRKEAFSLKLRVKIGVNNEASIKLFESLGFVRVGEENYFGEVELVWLDWIDQLGEVLEKCGLNMGDIEELEYPEHGFGND